MLQVLQTSIGYGFRLPSGGSLVFRPNRIKNQRVHFMLTSYYLIDCNEYQHTLKYDQYGMINMMDLIINFL